MQRRVSLAYRLYAGLVLVALSSAAATGFRIDRHVQQNSLSNYQQRLEATVKTFGQMTASALFGDLDPHDTSLNAQVGALARAVDTHLSLLAMDGSPVADSDREDPRAAGSQARKPEVVQARGARLGVAVRDGRLWVAQVIERDGRPLGIARASIEMRRVQDYVTALRWRVASAAGGAALIALALGALISLGIVRPVRRLADDARRIGEGDLAHRARAGSNDELGDLARAFNEMSAGLQAMVAKLNRRNDDMRVVLDNVGQGLVTADRDGVVQGERSAVVDRWFGPVAEGARLWDLFEGADARALGSLEVNWEQLFEDVLPLELSLAQLPSRVDCGGTCYELTYEPIREGDRVVKLLVVLSDVTASVHAERVEAEQRDLLALFDAVNHDRRGFEGFVAEGRDLAQQIARPDAPPVELKRAIHTLKGISSLFGVQRVAATCHDVETRMADAGDDALLPAERDAIAAAWGAVQRRVPALLGESCAEQLDVRAEDVDALQRLIEDGEERAMLAQVVGSWKMEPVDRRFGRLGEQARQLALRLGKPAPEVAVASNGVRLDAKRWAPFWSAMSHVIRNAVDHGLEAAGERGGKAERGRIELRAWADRGGVQLEVRDDGRGVDWAAIGAKARGLGLPAATHDDLVAALFADGVSTRGSATEHSGRGVGMAAVLGATRALGGRVEVESGAGGGALFRFRFPLHAAVRTSFRPGSPSLKAAPFGATNLN